MARTKKKALSDTVETAPVDIGRLPGRSQEPETFWEFWKNCEEKAPKRTYAYFYRGWPVIDTKKGDSEKTKMQDKLFFCTQEDILHKHGSGDYKLMLHDGYKASGSTLIGSCYVRLRDEQFPPVLDPKDLVMTDPNNRDFIRQLRARGVKLPGDEPVDNTDKVIAAINQQNEKKDTETALKETVSLLSTGAKEAMGMMREVYSQAPKGPSVIEQITPLLPILKEFLRPPDNGIRELIQLQIQQGKENVQMFTAALEKLAERRNPAEPADPVMKRLQARFYEKVLDNMDREEPATAAPQGTMEQIGKFLEGIAPLAATLLERFAPAAGEHQQHPQQAPHQAIVMPQAAAPPPPRPAVPPNPTTPAAATNGVPQPPTTPPPAAGAGTADPVAALLAELANPLLRHFQNPDYTGDDFAHWLIEGYGRETYDFILQNFEAFRTAIERHPRILPVMAGNVSRAQTFLTEFVNYDALAAQREEEDETEEETPAKAAA